MASDDAPRRGPGRPPKAPSPSRAPQPVPAPDLVEPLAELAHAQWSGWLTYMFGFIVRGAYNVYRLDRAHAERWQRQMATTYTDLPAEEKESDRAEARRVLALLLPLLRPYIYSVLASALDSTDQAGDLTEAIMQPFTGAEAAQHIMDAPQ